MVGPTRQEKAMLVATIAAGILASYEHQRMFENEHEPEQSFDEWAVLRAFSIARSIHSQIGD